MRALLASALLLVLATGCEDEPAPVASEPTASGFCSELDSTEDLVGVEAPTDLTPAEAEGYRLLTEQGIAPPEGPQDQQAITAFANYLEETCPGQVDSVLADLDETVTALDTAAPAPSATASPTEPASPVVTPDNGPFCASWVAMTEASLGAIGRDLTPQVRAFQDWLVEVEAKDLADELPADARAGLDVFAELIGPLDPDTVTQREIDRLEKQASAQDERDIDAMGVWVDQNCGF